MNLYIEVDGLDIDVWQTPTHITEMCLMDHEGRWMHEVSGNDALRAVFCYTSWVESTLNGKYDSEEDFNQKRYMVQSHIKETLDAVNKGKKIIAYTL
jgi:NMD protein affecting ribosome stability and mRNA decay